MDLKLIMMVYLYSYTKGLSVYLMEISQTILKKWTPSNLLLSLLIEKKK